MIGRIIGNNDEVWVIDYFSNKRLDECFADFCRIRLNIYQGVQKIFNRKSATDNYRIEIFLFEKS